MRNLVELEPGIYAAGQIEATDFEEIRRLGIRSVMGNRPDEELDGQSSSRQISHAATGHGISFRYLPVWGFELTSPEHLAEFRETLADLPGPVLLYCRSGRRSTIMWAQIAVERLGIDTVVAIAGRAGFDPGEIQAILEENSDQLAA